jgi:CelD/BcsL family acetyltransferase involved in cellulose biosynthesis
MSAIEVARTFDEAEAMRPAWEALRNDFLTSNLDFVLTYCRHTPGVVRPHVVLLEEDGAPAGMAVARLEDARLPTKFGYKVVLNPAVRALTVVYGGLLGASDERSAGRLVNALYSSLADERVDIVRFRMLTVGSPEHAVAAGHVPFLRRQRFPTRMPHWHADLPDSLDTFLARRSKRRRETVRRYARRLERTYGDDARVEIVRDAAGLDRLFADSRLVHRETYQHVLGVGFSDENVQRRLAELAADRGWFRGYMLYLRDRPAAFWHGNAYEGRFGVGATGFDPTYAEDRPGNYLLMKLVQDLCSDGTVRSLDFGFGDADYKRTFGDRAVDEEDVAAFSPRARTVGLNAMQTALHGATAAGRALAARSGALADLRRRRRAGKRSGLRSFFLGVFILLGVYTAAGLAAGPAVARGPDRTMSSDLLVDGARRPDPPGVVREAPRLSLSGTRRPEATPPALRRRPRPEA